MQCRSNRDGNIFTRTDIILPLEAGCLAFFNCFLFILLIELFTGGGPHMVVLRLTLGSLFRITLSSAQGTICGNRVNYKKNALTSI